MFSYICWSIPGTAGILLFIFGTSTQETVPPLLHKSRSAVRSCIRQKPHLSSCQNRLLPESDTFQWFEQDTESSSGFIKYMNSSCFFQCELSEILSIHVPYDPLFSRLYELCRPFWKAQKSRYKSETDADHRILFCSFGFCHCQRAEKASNTSKFDWICRFFRGISAPESIHRSMFLTCSARVMKILSVRKKDVLEKRFADEFQTFFEYLFTSAVFSELWKKWRRISEGRLPW